MTGNQHHQQEITSEDSIIKLKYSSEDIQSVNCFIKENTFFAQNKKIGQYKLKDKTVYPIIAPVYGKLIEYQSEEHIFIIEKCRHETFFYNLCVECNFDKSQNPTQETDDAKYSSLHSTLTFSRLKAQKEEQTIVNKYLDANKLILLLDLDNTILHTCAFVLTEEEYISLKAKYGISLGIVYIKKQLCPNKFDKVIIKFRPHLKEFFIEICEKYEIYTYTHGTREYAIGIIKYINTNFDGEFLSSERLIAREQNVVESKTIKKVFPTTEDMIVILDDRSNVWEENDNNLINLRPYGFFYDEQLNKIKEKYLSVDYDNVLYSIRKILSYVHASFYDYYKRNKMRKSVKITINEKMKSIFNGQSFITSGLFNKDGDIKLTFLYNQISNLGGELYQNLTDKENIDCLLIDEYKKTNKVNVFEKQQKPIIHFSYIDLCYMLFVNLPYQDFIMSKEKSKLEPINVITLFNDNKDKIDAFWSLRPYKEDSSALSNVNQIDKNDEVKEENEINTIDIIR